jgi:hypothetical protein
VSKRQQARAARMAAHLARKRSAAGGDPGRLCAVEFDEARAAIKHLPPGQRIDAYRLLAHHIRDARDLIAAAVK